MRGEQNVSKMPRRYHFYYWFSQKFYATRIEQWFYERCDDYVIWWGDR